MLNAIGGGSKGENQPEQEMNEERAHRVEERPFMAAPKSITRSCFLFPLEDVDFAYGHEKESKKEASESKEIRQQAGEEADSQKETS